MRKSLIVSLLLLPLVLASVGRATAAMGDWDSSSPWSNPVTATSMVVEDDNGVSIANLFTAAPRFNSVASCIVPTLGLAHWTDKDADRSVHPAMFLLTHSFLI
jgi:hypothetical protein